jgi:hypothetical protein
VAEADRKLRTAEVTAKVQQDEFGRLEAYASSLQGKVKAQAEYVSSVEARLQEERKKAAPLLGMHLEELSSQQLAALARLHEEGLHRAQTMLANRYQEEGAEAVATAAANLVTGSSSPKPTSNMGLASTPNARTNLGSTASSIESMGSITSARSEQVWGDAARSDQMRGDPLGASTPLSSLDFGVSLRGGVRSATQSPVPGTLFATSTASSVPPSPINGSLFSTSGVPGPSPYSLGTAAGGGNSKGFAALGNGTFAGNGLLGGTPNAANRSSSTNMQHVLW